jgi:tRNA-Thr(GGU) m(6)t(6)A37 methyltransferase TsaA
MLEMKPIGRVRHNQSVVPRHYTVSNVEGELVIQEKYRLGLRDIRTGQKIVVLFHFHKSPSFNKDFLQQKPPHRRETSGVFSICSPIRPNPLGLSIVKVIGKRGNRLRVKGLDMLDNTPILDIKPLVL